MSWNKWFLKFQRLVVLSKCWEPPHIVTQHHSPQDHSRHSRPAVFQVILKLPFHPHTAPLFSLGSVSAFLLFLFLPLFVLGMFVKVIRTILE